MTIDLARTRNLSPEEKRTLPADLARGLETAERAEATTIAPVGRDAAIPPSLAQQRLWFLEQRDGTGAAYHLPMRLRLRGALDRDALDRALDRIVARHEALRTTFPAVDGEPVQRIAPVEESGLRLVEHDLRASSDAEDELRRLVSDEAGARFDLEHGPLIRGRLVRMAADDHVLLLTMHPIVSDGWSMGVLRRELGALYAAFRDGRPDPLPELPVQYADYAVWQRGWIKGELLERQADYWRETLAGAPEVLELPADHPRPAKQDLAGASVEVVPDEALTAALKTLSQRHGATLFMTLLAGWAAVLARLSGQADVVIGTPSANRARPEVEELIGFFVNTLALRVDLSARPTVAELLAQVKARALEAQRNQDIPFEQVVELVQPARSLAHTPLFQVMFACQNAPDGALELPGLSVDAAGVADADTSRFDLSLVLWEDDGRIAGVLNYATALFDRATVERWVGYLRRVLEEMAANETQPVDQLELLSAEERAQVVVKWNATDAAYPREACIHALFEGQVERTPGSEAVSFEDETLSYAELNARANRLAHHLRSLGVGPDARVALCVERGVEMVVAMLAVLKAGGAYVPLDPSYPDERLRYMLSDSRPAVLLASRAQATRFASAGVPVLDPADEAAWAHLPTTDPRPAGLSPDHLAYVIYTSGSTGRPKGVTVPHRGVVSLLADMQRRAPIGEGDGCSLWTSTSFDVSVYEIFSALLAGGRLCIPRDEARLEAGAFLDWMEAREVRSAYLPPYFLAELRERVSRSPGRSRLHRLLVGVEPIAEPLLAEIRRGVPGLRIVNGYGPTETTICATLHDVPDTARGERVTPIGAPAANTRVFVLDGRMGPVPVGVVGELYVGGVGVARGYLDRPALTAERFVPDPLSGEAGARLYRTGDLGRWLPEGALAFAGRTDAQVKIRGFRVEPGEIEARLAEHPAVREAVVLAREDAPGEKRLVAYVVGDETGVDVLRAHLAERLPEHMVPAAYVRLDAMPLTPSGKLDRKALPAPDFASAAGRYEAPRTPVEEVVAGIWAEVLKVERAGVHDNFLDLGGHSLLATGVVSRIREVFGVEVPLGVLFEGPTVAEVARRVEEMRRAELPVVPSVVPVERTGALPLSFAQERLWFLHQMDPEGTAYNVPWPSRLRGRLDASALERALGELVRRHESLRTTFRPVEQGAVQVIHPAAPAPLPVLDLTALDLQEREQEARRLEREDAERPFDLEGGPLFRATLLRLSDEEHVLLLAMHHIVSDGWSMGVLFRELFTLYDSYSQPSGPASPASPLPPLAVQYADFAVWQRGWLQGEVLRRQIDWWRERLGGAPPALELPTDRPRPAVASSRGAAHLFRIPAEITRGLRSLARREGATLYMVTHAALDLLLSRWSGQEDLVVGSPIAGRTHVGTEELIGFFVNTLALRIDLSGDPSFQELVRRVRETALGAYAHQELPFERLVEDVAPDRGLSHTPLVQVMFALQNAGYGEGPAIAGLRLEPFGSEVRTFGSDSGTVRFDLELDLTEVGEELVGTLRFRTDLFDAATMERFAAQYGVVLAAAAASPEERLSHVAILPSEEARTLLSYGSGPTREYAGDAPVHRLFAAQAARTPEAPALLFAGESLTYAELDARAERLARRLRGLGVGVGTTVAVCLERSPGVLVALLSVWKAGGVYLPLDPAHPAERLSFLMHDSGAKLVISDSTLAGVLPKCEAEVVLLDGISTRQSQGAEEDGAATVEVLPSDLAYLIYTSGSTGTPKAVMVEHAQLTHTLRASLETLGFAPGDVVAALASTAFDISLLELVTPLLAGGTVRIIPRETARDPEALVEAAGDVGVLHAVPALMRQVVEVVRGGGTLPSLRLLLVGGDSVPPDLLEDMREVFPDARTVVLYGPTEAAIICATYAVPAEGAVAGHPLGRPLPGVHLDVRGPRGELAPLGIPGELWISGGGVARGYLGRPELNAEKFVSTEGERAYRTGDRARWRPDGVLEFLGRTDEQVKVRGFRIEPGEVEAVLREQPGVREAVVLAREDAPGDRRLVAYVVPGADGVETAGGGREQVSEWETLFDDTYAQDEGEDDPTLQLKGWNSSYTGEPIPREEMRAWVEQTTDRILALRPERVLEIGTGTGLLLFRVAPHVRAYHGTDFSGVALEHVRRHAAELSQVVLSEREADDLAEFAGAGFDTVVVNSVAQYFPDVDYLLRVLEGAAAALRPGGRIFVGDVRSLPLAGAFHASVELARAPDDLTAERLQARVRRGMAEEQELLVDPALFEALQARIPRLGRVEVQVKRGEYDNEVSRFRYDVILHMDAAAAATAPVVREWSGEEAARLRALAAETGQALLVRGVPDARVREHVRALELISSTRGAATAGEVRALAEAGAGDGIQPEALFALGEEIGRATEVRPGAAGTLDVLFHPAGGVSAFPMEGEDEQPWEVYANDPQWGRRMRALVPALREAARARLPEYMVPNAFVVLEAFPVTPNGKVDRAALPAPDTPGSRGETYVAPRTLAEERMAGIWAEVLGVERVGAEDHFFDLGGHSLLATQLISRVREAFRTELPLRAVFEAPTLAELTGRVEALRAETSGDAEVPPLVPVPRDGSPLPLSFAQQRQWFIDQLEGAGAAYHVAWRVRLRGELDRAALARALERIVARHESLRTTFPAVQGEPEQRIAPAGEHGFTLRDYDLTGCADVEGELRRLAAEEIAAPFALAVGPLVRGRLVRIGPDDHALLLTMHHVVGDGWSVGVLARELGVLYTAFSRGEPDPLPPLPVQYADYSVWHRRWVGSPAVEAQAEYWTATLAGAPELLELPTDRPRPARQDFSGASVTVELDEALTAALRRLSQRHGTTPFMTLLAAWAVVLARLSGQNDVVVGSPIAGRTRGEVEGLIGFFVNTLALRVELSGAPTVAELLKHVRERALEALRNQDFPFEQVVERVRPTRSLSHTPLFQVALAWQEMTGGQLELPGIAAATIEGVEEEAAAFDLMLNLAPRGGRITGDVTYATALFDRVTVERYVGYLRRVLQAMVADDSTPVDRLELLSPAERRRVAEEWNATGAAFPAACVHERFAAQVERTPGAAALVFEDETLSYAELNARANRLAHHLRSLGVGPEARVGICAEQDLEMVVGVLGVLKAGGAYVPLDPGYPAERLAYMLADSAPTAMLVQTHLRDRVATADVAVVELDAAAPAWASLPATDPGRGGLTPEHLAYVIYTSGSTGRPKGVRVPHGSLGATLAVAGDAFGLGAGDRVPSLASFAFDIWLFETILPLLAGGAVRLIPRERVPDVPRLMQDLARCTALHAVPALMRRIVEEVRATPEGVLGTLRHAFVGGDAVAPDLVEEMRAAFPAAEIHVMYGPTEAAILCAAHRLGSEPVTRQMVGRPLGNAALYVVEPGGTVAPVGVPGELCLGGASVARDYLGRPGLTAERFVPDPFSAQPGARLYRTGDRVRWVADGSVEFLGRTDHQVKIRGFRIEPGEIEARLAEHAGVREALVLVREDAPGEKRLVAYVAGDETATAEVLRAHLSERLPEYMVPAAYVRLDALPLTPNGKVDRRALPAPEGDAFSARGYEAPSGKAEEAVAAIWAELLGAERVGRRDHFFELGGHSLLAVRMVSRVRQALGVEASPRDVFERPVLADFARGVRTAARADGAAIERVDRTGAIPLSFAQQRLWFLEQLGNLGSTYHIPMRLRLRGELDREALAGALDRIVARHEALRTSFPAVGGEPVQHVAPESALRLVEHDLRGRAEAEDELRRLVQDEANAPFDLARGPLVRGRLVRMAADDHVLLLTMHHIVSDGWSTGVLFRELGALYAAFARGEPDPLPPLPVQYADYAVWHRRWVDGPVLEAQAEYWTRTLAGAPELLELPTDRPRPAKQDFAGAVLNVELDEALTAALKTLGKRHGTTLFMTLLAGWAAVLARLSEQDDVVIGTPSANRGRSEIEGLIGFFVNMLPLRVRLAGAPTVAALLDRVRALALEAQQNQDIPFEQVVERVQPARSLAHAPLFQVMFAWQNASDERLDLPGVALGPLDPADSGDASTQARLDLSLTLWEEDGRITGDVEYATALFDRATVERHVDYLHSVLEAMAADDLQAVDALPLLPEARRRLVVEEWNRTDAEEPRDACVHALFEAQVARVPGAAAVVFDGGELTYAELNARANRLAHHLAGRGVGPGARVAICVERGPEMVVGLLAILKAGGAYVPLDPDHPRERLRTLLADSAPVLVLTQGALRKRFTGARVPVVALDRDAPAWAREPEHDPAPAGLTPGHLAYVIYTSGSTGAPKGVMVAHRSVARQIAAVQAGFGLGADDRSLQFASVTFDASVEEIFGALLSGAALVLRGEHWLEDAHTFWSACARHRVTVVDLPTRFWQLLLDEPSAAVPECVRLLVIGGEAVGAAALDAWFRRGGHRPRLFNAYGPTEATVNATLREVTGDPATWRSIGRPVAHTRAYLLDPRGRPVPVGVAGELYLGGGQVARGYLDRPGLTAGCFVPDPFGGEPGARLYRTGDLGRWLADGGIEYLGRTDFQVKIRGFRIELGEIEARLREHAGVREAVVAAREDVPGDRRLVAYYVGEAEAEALRAHLSERLPGYMVPAAYVRLEALPLTPSGKLDRGALPVPEGDAFATRGYAAPVGETERALAEVWSELLGVEPVGRRDHFFELGGHSLLAVRVISRVRQALGAEVAIADLFERPVLADLARAIEHAARTEVPPIERVDRGGRLPLSLAQQRLWFLAQLGTAGTVYHVSWQVRLRGALDRGALARALERIVARHESLRTTFPAVDGEPEQRIAPADAHGFALPEHDLAGRADAEDALRRLAEDEGAAPFDLAVGPLVRGRLVRMGADDHALLLTMHHVVSDGWSIGVLYRELGALYAAFARGEPDPLPPLPVQYADYAAWQRRWLAGAGLEAQGAYWSEALAGAPELLELPTDHPRPAKQDFAGASVEVELDAALTASLKALGQRHGATLLMTVLAGWAVVLARLSGQDDVVVGTPSAGRGRAEIEGLIGFFVNTLALRVDLSGAPTVAQLLGRVRERALEAQRHQDLPFEQVVERVRPARSMAHTPVFQAMLGWQELPGGEMELPGVTAALEGSEDRPAPFDLSLDLAPRGGRISGELTYATALFDRATAERHVGYLRRVLEEMAADDAKPVDRLELLSAAERRMVVEEWNATGAEYPAGACIHELFEARVEEAPGAEAVSFEGARLTYAELNARANRVAHHLRALGVGPEVRVAVCVERGMETVVALLAVFKAGGGYVPLDPTHPEDRIRYTLEDSAPAALLAAGPLAARFAGAGVPVVDLGDGAAWDAYPASDPDAAEVGVGPGHLAYVIYTSGSTGRPKGVLVRHGSLVNLLAVTRAAFGVGPGDLMPAMASTTFDISLFELLLPLVSGAEVRIVTRQRVMDTRALLAEIADATLLHAVPAFMRLIAQAERPAPTLARLRGTFVGGDQVPSALLAEMSAAFPAARTHILYGPTEATILASAHAVPADGAVAGHPIGRPLGNVRLYACDAHGQPQPVGVAGELLIGGMGVARGYLGRPALTAERFVPDPFSGVPGARLYRTGDRARWRAGTERGFLEFLGRTDFQVKIRGFRIEPGEIEARLREHPAVRQAVVLAREDTPGVKRLVAYVVGEAAIEALRAHLDARLPSYMVPAAYVRLEALPLTSNGKLDRKALPAPDAAAYAAHGHEPPRNMTEQVLAEIWAEVLGVERVGRRDHFFDLGGHSLLAVRLVSRVREALNPAATVEDVFTHPTLYELAARLQGNGDWFGTTHAIPIRETGSERPLFVAHDAVGIVFYGQILRPHLDAEIPVYALPGPLNDTDELGSLDDLVTRLVRMITKVQPEGPYRLAGWSAGGVFAYAVAERLVQTGRAVEFVGLLDTFHPATRPDQDSPRARQFTVLDLLARDSGVTPATPEALQALNEDTQGQDLPAFIAACKARGLLPETVTVERAERMERRIALLKRSHAAYVPGPLPVPVYLFVSDDAADTPRCGWEDMPGGAPFRLERVPGTHHTMWKKGNVEVTGATISRAIRASAAGEG